MRCSRFSKYCKQATYIGLLVIASFPVRADWSDWWRTPQQKAQAAFEAQQFEELKSIAPEGSWQGVAQHKSNEFEAAAKTFSDIATQQMATGNARDANRALYNQGVSEVRAGQYEKAVQAFDQVLQQDPEFEDAKHNREIAQQLIELQEQQEQQQSQDGDGEDSSSEEGDQQQSESSAEEGEEQQDSDQSESEQGDSDEQSSDESGEESGNNSDAAQAESEAQRLKDEQAARDALEAEAQAQAVEDEQSDTDAQNAGMQESEEPISESEQATEQWLRRIPDDPAGLLRRKLEQSHRTDYPEVRDAQEPW